KGCMGGGIGGVGVGDGAPDARDPRALGIVLDRVTPTDISLDAVEAEFRVVNTGLVPIDIPVSPHLSDLQPPDEWAPFSYCSLALLVRLAAVQPVEALGIGWVELYGSAKHQDTLLTVKPGQWLRVKAKVKLHTWPSQPVEAQLTADFRLRENTFTPQNGGGFTDIMNLYPNRITFPGVHVHFSPTRSAPDKQIEFLRASILAPHSIDWPLVDTCVCACRPHPLHYEESIGI